MISLKRLSLLDVVLTLLLLVICIFFTLELWQAFNATSCIERVYDGCYPWGAEGPSADSWFYKTKSRYLLQGTIWNLFLLSVIAAFLRLPKDKKKTFGLLGGLFAFAVIWWGMDMALLAFF